MADIQKLKALAEAAKSGGADWSGLDINTERMYEAEDALVRLYEFGTPVVLLDLIAEIERLQRFEVAYKEFSDKTDWVQETAHWSELGMHRADVLRKRVDQLKAENEALRDAAAVAAMRIKELDLLFGRYILAMRAAVIEDEHGKTETAGMDWIFNSLAGPGQLPPEGETDAQAYFDREIVAVDKGMEEVMAFHDQRHAVKSKESSHG